MTTETATPPMILTGRNRERVKHAASSSSSLAPQLERAAEP